MTVLDLKNSNDEFIKLIQSGKPFSIVRLGLGDETYLTFDYITKNHVNKNYLHPITGTLFNAGIYFNNNDINKLILFIKFYESAIKNSDLLASFDINNTMNKIGFIENYFSQKHNLLRVYSRTLESFFQVQEGIKPWTHYLLGKKILIINPFVDSFQKQLNNGFKIFKDNNKQIFLEGQEFTFYKSFQTIAGNHIHNDWFETFMIMCNDIKNIDFDIALLGCGGYGLPLCDFIKTKLGKSAIYIGGGLQLLFGVMGKRWENNPMWKQIILENDCKFIKPSNDEKCNNLNHIEGGCYW